MENTIVCEQCINDMPRGWTRENDWNNRVYRKWQSMVRRIYSEEFTSKECNKCYIEVVLCLEWHWLSKFTEDIKKIDGYDEEKFLNGELEIDKDIKSNGNNKEYSLKNCMFVSKTANVRQSNKTRSYEYMKGENNHNKNGLKEETKKKISESRKGKYCGENSGNYGLIRSEETKRKISESKKGKTHKGKKVAQYDKNNNLIKVWNCIKNACDELKISSSTISACLKGRQKTAGGFIWKYYEK